MKKPRFPLAALILASCLLAAACARTVAQKELFWRGELWDGMNRMTFTLQDLGFELKSVDTDSGMIEAEMPSADSGQPLRITIRFSSDPELPIRIEAAHPEGRDADPGKLRKATSEISKRFAWYGGPRVEVRDQKAPSVK